MGYGFLFNIDACIGCQACAAACAKKNDFFLGFRRVQKYELKYRGKNVVFYYSNSCNHCENPECLRRCPERLYFKRRDGIVIHKMGECRACLTCLKACPYQAPKFNHQIGKVSKCNLCVDETGDPLQPKCVKACPTFALQLVHEDYYQPMAQYYHLPIDTIGKSHITQPSIKIIIPPELQKNGEN
ncbi:MAG: 4Fe-4S dicluster domain-containing protein [Clostridia bacterium]|nr:4Fe-4S dicluster domain-containing protein [Clostridia bacterium]